MTTIHTTDPTTTDPTNDDPTTTDPTTTDTVDKHGELCWLTLDQLGPPPTPVRLYR